LPNTNKLEKQLLIAGERPRDQSNERRYEKIKTAQFQIKALQITAAL